MRLEERKICRRQPADDDASCKSGGEDLVFLWGGELVIKNVLGWMCYGSIGVCTSKSMYSWHVVKRRILALGLSIMIYLKSCRLGRCGGQAYWLVGELTVHSRLYLRMVTSDSKEYNMRREKHGFMGNTASNSNGSREVQCSHA